MTCDIRRADSDSVNLGSNPGPPATTNADVSGISQPLPASEKPEQPERTAHTGRTEVGTADLVARLRFVSGGLHDEAAEAIERLSAALLSAYCPAGGYTGQPKNEEPIVQSCISAGLCGCTLGAAVGSNS